MKNGLKIFALGKTNRSTNNLGAFYVYFIQHTLFRSKSEVLDEVAEYIFITRTIISFCPGHSLSKEELNHFPMWRAWKNT